MPADSRGDKTIAIVLYPGLTVLDLIGPLQVLKALEGFAPQYRTVVVGARTDPVDTDIQVHVIADATFDELRHPYVILVPGGRMATIRAMSDPVIRDYVRTAASSAEVVTSVCTGSLILASVGLLEGRHATTNWAFYKILESLGATYRRDRWLQDGNIITSAGVSAGLDMGLYLASRLTDEATARRVQLAIDYDPQPPFGRIDWTHMRPLPRALRSGISLAAPVIAAKPKRLTRSDRRPHRSPSAATPKAS